MTDGELSWVWKLIDLVTGPKALLVSIISLIFLTPLDFASERQLRVFGVYPLVHPIRPWVTLALWLAISVLLAVFVRWSLSQIQIMAVAFGQKRGMRKYLVEGMPNDQLKIITTMCTKERGHSRARSIVARLEIWRNGVLFTKQAIL